MRQLTRIAGYWCILALMVPAAWGWGQSGHRIVALIAAQRLSPEVSARVAKLLLDGQFTMDQVSTCADSLRSAEVNPIRPAEAYCLKLASPTTGSGLWHYIDIPISDPKKDLAAYCPDGNCVTGKIKQFTEVLRTSNDDAKRREALMYLIHFVGDVHQPLHCAERSCDQGGNLERVVVAMGAEHPEHRLHGAWDGDFVSMLMQAANTTDEKAYAALLAGSIKPAEADRWKGSSLDEIAWNGWELAKDHAYKSIPYYNYCDPVVKATPTPSSTLSAAYESDGQKVVEEQLKKAGVRLAALLEANLTR